MKSTIIFLLLNLIFIPVFRAQSLEDKIKAVENSLGGWARLENSKGWNISDRMAHYKVKGLSIAVIDNYKIVWAKGYGEADTIERRPVTVNTLFQPASIGKSLHAVGTMKLVEQGKIDPKRDINDYLKRWKFPYDSLSRRKEINLLQLLSHSAGLSVHGFDGYKWGEPLPNIIQILNGEPPSNSPAVRSEFEPGKKFQYSGGGYTISGMIVEDVSNMKYAAYMTKTVLAPLGMNHTCFYGGLTADAKKNLATGYRFDGKPMGCKYHIYPEDACGASLWSTPTDFAKLIIELQLSLKGKSNKVLSQKTVQQLFTPYVSDFYGLGFFLEKKGKETYFHHTGLNEGFISDYYGSLEGGHGVVIMANSDIAAFEDITEEIINSVATVYEWERFYQPVIKKEIIIKDDMIKKYTGKYLFTEDPNGPSLNIFEEKGKLWFHFNGTPDNWEMHFTAPDEFFMFEAQYNNQVFINDNSGKTTALLMRTLGGGEVKAVKE
jgi:CubicO group peptidase (beta-lactamase class C family)